MKYTVEIIDDPFIRKESLRWDKTAVVTFDDKIDDIGAFDETDRKVVKYGYVDKVNLYKLIDEQKPINLNRTYVENFSLIEYRREKEYRDHYTLLPGLTASKSFFNGNSYFEFADFGDGNIDFSKATFGNGDVSFYKAKFGNGNVSFKDATFGDGRLAFMNVKLENGGIDFRDVEFGTGEIHFSNANFGESEDSFNGVNFGNRMVSFTDITFKKGYKLFANVKFGNGDVEFFGVNFEKNLDLTNTKFGNGSVEFTKCVIKDGVSFRYAIFGTGDINFSNIEFGDWTKIDFSNSKFGDGNVYFSHVTIGRADINISNAVLGNGNNNFYFEISETSGIGAAFGSSGNTGNHRGIKPFDFAHVTYGYGKVNFSWSKFGNLNLSFKNLKINNVDFTLQKLGNVDFGDCLFQGHVKMNGVYYEKLDLTNAIIEKTFDLTKANIRELVLINTKNLGQIYLDWRENQVSQMIQEQNFIYDHSSTYLQKAHQFRLLKENFRNIGQYDDEDEAYIAYKSHLRRASIWGELAPIGLVAKLKYCFYNPIRSFECAFDFWILEYLGGYATKPKRIVLTMGIIVIIFAFIFMIPGILDLGNNSYGPIKAGIYHSLITFLTIGYGDVTPKSWRGIILCGIEGFLGMFLMSYFTVAFVRKVLR